MLIAADLCQAASIHVRHHIKFDNLKVVEQKIVSLNMFSSSVQSQVNSKKATLIFINMKPLREVIAAAQQGMGKKTLFVI